ncbi:Ig-like domain-containing protein [Dokdonella sp.]|uniref:Ig-like domain-containing protein n=1 Tax=Dokdonella sp. TaxID=2291710 RepID=UPI001B09CAF6|nr:Ig-like domain-containing protein [Dokdonella sp.]MBO9664616.1 Ig-like domain repeat protein [Dokdonella sp.]
MSTDRFHENLHHAARGTRRAAFRPLAVAIAFALLPAPAARAATIVVTNPGDTTIAAPDTCTLRQAIQSMNTSTLSGDCVNSGGAFGSGDTIRFAAGIHTVTLADAPANQLTVLDYDLTIDAGAGRNVTVERPVDAQNEFTVIAARNWRQVTHWQALPGRLTLIGLTVQNGVANQDTTKYGYSGGGVAGLQSHLTLERCVVRNNQATAGGGVFAAGGSSSLTLRSSLISGNRAEQIAGGIGSNNAISITDSTIEGNWADDMAGAIMTTRGPLTLVNSTVSGNMADDATAIQVRDPRHPVTLLNSTIACNSAFAGPSSTRAAIDVLSTSYTSINAISTILANTSNTACTTATAREIRVPNGSTQIAGERNLLVGANAIDASAPFANTPSFGDPKLGALQDNGGATPTRALLPGSPAINAGSNPSGLAHDQRGGDYARAVGGSADVGAYEFPYAGLCGSAHGGSFVNLGPASPGLCSSSAFLQGGLIGSGPWVWFCAANADPSSNEFCRASVAATAALGVTNAAGNPIGTSIYGEPLRLTSIVSGGASSPTGSVSFFDATVGNYVPLCVGVPLGNGAGASSALCDVPVNALGVGPRVLKAVYGGSTVYGSTSSAGVPLTVQPASSTTASPVLTPDPVTIGTPLGVTAQVTANAPSLAGPLGEVTVEDQTDDLSCRYDLADPEPGCTLTPLSAGLHTVLVTYPGDGNIGSSSATTIATVLRAGTTTTIAAPAAIAFGQSVEVAVDVAGAVAIGAPGGSVLVSAGASSCSFDLASATRCTLTPLAHGALALQASYAGDARFEGSDASVALDVVPHTIGGTLAGLTPGNSVVLRLAYDGGAEELSLAENSAFAFGAAVPAGANYTVSVLTQPADPPEVCTIANGSGSMGVENRDDVVVTCIDSIFADDFDP